MSQIETQPLQVKSDKINIIIAIGMIAIVVVSTLQMTALQNVNKSLEQFAEFGQQKIEAQQAEIAQLKSDAVAAMTKIESATRRAKEFEEKYQEFRMWTREMFAARTGQGQAPVGDMIPGELPKQLDE